jgi:hypothetical protein
MPEGSSTDPAVSTREAYTSPTPPSRSDTCARWSSKATSHCTPSKPAAGSNWRLKAFETTKPALVSSKVPSLCTRRARTSLPSQKLISATVGAAETLGALAVVLGLPARN